MPLTHPRGKNKKRQTSETRSQRREEDYLAQVRLIHTEIKTITESRISPETLVMSIDRHLQKRKETCGHMNKAQLTRKN